MIHLLKLLIFGHVHKWETVEKLNIQERTRDRLSGPFAPTGPYITTGKRFICRCETCGSYKAFDL